MARNIKELIRKVILDLVLLATVGIPIFIFHFYGKPKERGFFCDDDSIRYPHRGSTISSTTLNGVGLFLPIILIILNELASEAKAAYEKRGQLCYLLGRPIPDVGWNIYEKLSIFIYGICISKVATDVAKYSIGRLRPHFIDVCNPSINCSLVADPHEYQVNFTCLKDDPNAILDARLSFPSDHAAFSAYTMMFTVLYLQAYLCCEPNRLLKPTLQFFLILMAWFTSLSRVADYKHHWSDVTIGFLIGIAVAIFVVFISDFFVKKDKMKEDVLIDHIAIDTTVPNGNPRNETTTT